MDSRIQMVDVDSGSLVAQCTGPAPDGSCPRVARGDVLPCAGKRLIRTFGLDQQNNATYVVSPAMTLCPVTIAASLAIPSDWDEAVETP